VTKKFASGFEQVFEKQRTSHRQVTEKSLTGSDKLQQLYCSRQFADTWS